MDLAREISEITRQEKFLLYHSPREIENILAKGNAVILKEGGKLAALMLWSDRAGWVEFHTGYVAPEFRGQGYYKKIQEEARKKILASSARNIFLFTRVPAIANLWRHQGIRASAYSALPKAVWLEILKHRLSPARWPSYFKHGLNIFKAASSSLHILEIKNPEN